MGAFRSPDLNRLSPKSRNRREALHDTYPLRSSRANVRCRAISP